jgi:hypothetical protein
MTVKTSVTFPLSAMFLIHATAKLMTKNEFKAFEKDLPTKYPRNEGK